MVLKVKFANIVNYFVEIECKVILYKKYCLNDIISFSTTQFFYLSNFKAFKFYIYHCYFLLNMQLVLFLWNINFFHRTIYWDLVKSILSSVTMLFYCQIVHRILFKKSSCLLQLLIMYWKFSQDNLIYQVSMNFFQI